MTHFFIDNRQHFFRPLTSKYREQIVECLRHLYQQMYSSLADYQRVIDRQQIIEIFQQAITRAPVLEEDNNNPESTMPVRSDRDQAIWVLNLLLEHGWLERQVDEATLQSSYAFSRSGRLLSQTLLESTTTRYRTRHRNTRNTRNTLHSFLEHGEIYDLLDAYEYSERIISDFTDVIAELDERKRQLVRDVESQFLVRNASDEFFDFMEKRFMPDLAVRLSADSVEKYRDEIQNLIRRIKHKPKTFKAQTEKDLRKVAPELLVYREQSILMMILDGIDSRMNNASEIMLPALRQALYSFTRRADIIIRQLSYTTGSKQNDLLPVCQALKSLPEQEMDERLIKAGEKLSVLNFSLVDPNQMQLHADRQFRVVNSATEEFVGLNKETRKELFLQRALDTAFSVNNLQLQNHIRNALNGNSQVLSQQLPITDAQELLLTAHAVEVSSNNGESSEFAFQVEPNGEQSSNEYFSLTDDFIIKLVDTDKHAE